ncbi:MAG: CbiX/SirB N-terminal domain-containing protein [Rubrivivax sp.]|nr:CbiX/SirB N-terminal domain-containing protein [Rubrivivax sp.]
MSQGLILFAHGARDPAWAAPFEAVAARLRALSPGLAVRLAFLEFMTPTLGEAGSELVGAGCGSVAVVPMFLGTGGHVRRDLPRQLAQMQAAHPAVTFTLHAAIGEVASVHEAMAVAIMGGLDRNHRSSQAR